MLLFYPSPVQEEPFIQLLYEICDLEHQVMVLQCIRVMTARMCDVALPVFLPVELFWSSVFVTLVTVKLFSGRRPLTEPAWSAA